MTRSHLLELGRLKLREGFGLGIFHGCWTCRSFGGRHAGGLAEEVDEGTGHQASGERRTIRVGGVGMGSLKPRN